MVLIFIHNVIITNLCNSFSLAEFLPREYQRVKFIDKEIFKVHVCTYIIQFRCKLRNTNILFVSTWYLYMLYSDVVFGCCTSDFANCNKMVAEKLLVLVTSFSFQLLLTSTLHVPISVVS